MGIFQVLGSKEMKRGSVWGSQPSILGGPCARVYEYKTDYMVMRELRISHDPFPALQHADVDGDGNPATFAVPEFPHIKLTLEDLMAPFGDPSSVAPMMELDGKLGKAIEESHGLIVNTFQGLEKPHDPLPALQHADVDGDGNPATFTVPEFPHIKLTLEDLMAPLGDPSSVAPMMELHGKLAKAIEEGHGLIVNTFQGLEKPYMEFWNNHYRPTAWAIGPLCLSQPASSSPGDAPPAGVLYVAFGTLAAIPEMQLKEVADGLERAEVDFIWAVRPENIILEQGSRSVPRAEA
ncbi:UDP-glycosyltransferase 90A1 [Triticum urartu]|uniref:UDP-glycosyltransferase 90A1 n=1 Tax=Triticum urartu TaxID=4572 RepID=M8A842_TRIUA|nr:UDP-glycosyltransferase 90A1 [Triticum urartu]